MAAVPLILVALTATSVLAEPTVYLREQFEDGGESFTPNVSLTAKPGVMNCKSHAYILSFIWQLNRLLFLSFFVAWREYCFLSIVPSARSLIKCFHQPFRPSAPFATIPQLSSNPACQSPHPPAVHLSSGQSQFPLFLSFLHHRPKNPPTRAAFTPQNPAPAHTCHR